MHLVHMLWVKILYVEAQRRPTESQKVNAHIALAQALYVEVYQNPTLYQIVNALVIQARIPYVNTPEVYSVLK